jgi:hypothetical protein
MSKEKKLAKKAGPRPPDDESRKPLNDVGNRWSVTNYDTTTGYEFSLIQRPKGDRMTKEERQRRPYLSDSAWKDLKNTKRKER